MKRLLIKLVKFYQLSISPLKAPCCKYYPTCSNYAIEAIERFGAFKGFFMAGLHFLKKKENLHSFLFILFIFHFVITFSSHFYFIF